jgi:hypothetical protein
MASKNEVHLVPEVLVGDSGLAAEGLWTREVPVKPHRCYRVTFRGKTGGLPETRPYTAGSFRLTVQTPDKRNLTPWNARMPPATDLARGSLGI